MVDKCVCAGNNWFPASIGLKLDQFDANELSYRGIGRLVKYEGLCDVACKPD